MRRALPAIRNHRRNSRFQSGGICHHLMHQANARGFRRVNHIALQHHARGIAAAHAPHHPGQDLRWHQAALGFRRGEARISRGNGDISRTKPAKPAGMG